MPDGYRIEKDSLGEMKVPENALYGALKELSKTFQLVVSFSADASLKLWVSSRSQPPKLMLSSGS